MKKVKQVEAGKEYEVLHTKSLAEKIFKIFALVWILITAAASFIVWKNAGYVQKYAVIKGVAEANEFLLKQYSELENRLTGSLDLNKYAGKVKIPEINANGIVESVAKAEGQANSLIVQLDKINSTVSGVASKAKLVGVNISPIDFGSVRSSISDIANSAGDIKKQVAGANEQAQKAVSAASAAALTDLNKKVHDEISGFGAGQMQKALALSDSSFALLRSGNYGFMTDAERARTAQIYAEFSKTSLPVVKQTMGLVKSYWDWISIGLVIICAIVMFVPIFFANKAKKIWTGFVEKCPYCGKLFIPKRAKFSVLKFVKFW